MRWKKNKRNNQGTKKIQQTHYYANNTEYMLGQWNYV